MVARGSQQRKCRTSGTVEPSPELRGEKESADSISEENEDDEVIELQSASQRG
jgi:hypothetical protein